MTAHSAAAWTAQRQGATLVIGDASTRANSFLIAVAADGALELDDDGAVLDGAAPAGCGYDAELALLRCDTTITAVTIDAGPGADSLTNTTALPATLLGGDGPDDLAGG